IERASKNDPADADVVLDVLGDARAAEVIGRLDVIAAWPADPRTSTRLIEYLRRPPIVGPSRRSVACPLLESGLSSACPRAGAAIAKLADDPREHAALRRVGRVVMQKLAQVADQMRDRKVPALPTELGSIVQEMGKRLDAPAKGKRDGESLLAAIYAAPDD